MFSFDTNHKFLSGSKYVYQAISILDSPNWMIIFVSQYQTCEVCYTFFISEGMAKLALKLQNIIFSAYPEATIHNTLATFNKDLLNVRSKKRCECLIDLAERIT